MQTQTSSRRKTIVTLVFVLIALAVVVTAMILTHDTGAEKTAWALLAPIIAIALALITKEVYSSLFIGIVIGALLAARGSFTGTIDHIVNDGLSPAIADNAGIFAFL